MNRLLTLSLLALSTPASAVTLTVWSHFTDTAEVAWLKAQTASYTRLSGNQVKIVNVPLDKLADQLIATAKKGKGPDLIVTLPQDRFGQLVTAGVLEPMDAYVARRGEFDRTTLTALTYRGKLYGLPMFAESVALVYNKKLVPTAPTSWNEFIRVAQKNTGGGKYGFVTDLSNAYMQYGLISAYGGYVFKNNSGTLDVKDIGLANAGAARALNLLNDLRFKYKLVPEGMTGDKAKAAFLKGDAAMIVTGPWDMGDIKKAGINYGITALPTPPGAPNPWSPFVGVQGIVMNAYSPNKAAAAEFARGMVTGVAQLSFNQAGGRIPVNVTVRRNLAANPIVNGFGRVITSGTPMPNVPEMGQVWTPWTEAITEGVKKPGTNASALLAKAVQTMQKNIK
ncbi:sugar ABC transporter substrate-binding protein [Deinococcus aquaedulcis]|uniref:sugar ABC transporter substrate-binding protein n=1 Tax=Deinococcus aquaedulcis TaxID=2840455 RepID=UPI001C8335A5|nr:maltose ABC transporter substrate-binding protein [Deinococcus aquaedulcis]